MKRWMGLMLLGAVLWMGWPPDVRADTCETRSDTSEPDYAVGKQSSVICDTHGKIRVQSGRATDTITPLAEGTITGFSYDLNGYARVTTSGSSAATATATEAAPTYTEGLTTAPLSLDLAGNLRTTLGTLIVCEDQGNQLCMVSGGAVRITTVVSGVTTDTTSTAQIVPTGNKTFYGQVVCSSGACVQTQAIYGDIDSDAANGILLCTLVLSGTTRDQASCPVSNASWSFYYVITTATSGTAAAGAIYAMY